MGAAITAATDMESITPGQLLNGEGGAPYVGA